MTTCCYRPTALHLLPWRRDKAAAGKHGLLLLCHRRSLGVWQATIMLQLEQRRRRRPRRTTALHNFNMKAQSHRVVTVTGREISGKQFAGNCNSNPQSTVLLIGWKGCKQPWDCHFILLWRLQLSYSRSIARATSIYTARQHQTLSLVQFMSGAGLSCNLFNNPNQLPQSLPTFPTSYHKWYEGFLGFLNTATWWIF